MRNIVDSNSVLANNFIFITINITIQFLVSFLLCCAATFPSVKGYYAAKFKYACVHALQNHTQSSTCSSNKQVENLPTHNTKTETETAIATEHRFVKMQEHRMSLKIIQELHF